MLTENELAQLTLEERSFYESSGVSDKKTMEPTLREKAKSRAAAKGIDLAALSSQSAPVVASPATQGVAAGSIPTRYGTARFVIGVVGFVGGAMIVLGVIWFLFSVVRLADGMTNQNPDGVLGLLGLLPSLGLIVGGILTVAHGQMLRATLDTADATREMFQQIRALGIRAA